jgi:paired box protein 2
VFFVYIRLLQDQVCSEKNIPSISSINRIIRDKAMAHRRGFDMGDSRDVSVEIFLSLLLE